MEILFVAIITLFLFEYNKKISSRKFFDENKAYLSLFKETDFDFLVSVKYGSEVDSNLVYEKRLQSAFIIFIFMLFMFLGNLTLVNLLFAMVVAYFVFKNGYTALKAYHKKHLHTVDTMLPYYLKSLEVLVQHYTVPVALTKSVDSAPEIFKSGLKRLLDRINSGDSSIEPYIEFALEYPVRDSMRMMRLLYRLGLGSQENKIEQLLVFSKTVSSLQSKAREVKYKERLTVFENKTMLMLGVTGGGVMIILLLALTMMF